MNSTSLNTQRLTAQSPLVQEKEKSKLLEQSSESVGDKSSMRLHDFRKQKTVASVYVMAHVCSARDVQKGLC